MAANRFATGVSARPEAARPRRLLVVLAHPDDEAFAMGGTLARLAAEGASVSLVCATGGERGRGRMQAGGDVQAVRRRELSEAAETLGVARVRILDYPDGGLAAHEEALGEELAAVVDLARPDAVITFGPDGISGHPDHLAVHRQATRVARGAAIRPALLYIRPSPATGQACGVPPRGDGGGRVIGVDIGRFRATKVRAMQGHSSQRQPFPGPPEREAEQLACHEYFTVAEDGAEIRGGEIFAAPGPTGRREEP